MSWGKDKGCRHCDDGALRPLFVVLRSFLPELEEDCQIICDDQGNCYIICHFEAECD